MMEIDKEKFLSESEHRLRVIYRAIAEGKKSSDTDRANLSGFIQAGIFLKITTKSECDEILARVHLEELGETIEERRAKNKARKTSQGAHWENEQTDFSLYETPTYLRR